MAFDKYLKLKEIKKVVDPGSGPELVIPEFKLIKESKDAERLIDKPLKEDLSPLTTVVEDLIIYSDKVEEEIQEAINEIDNYNNISDTFNKYHLAIKENYIPITEVIKGTRTVPNSPIKIKTLERDVYRNINDPRGPFIHDLYNIKSEVEASKYLLKNYWEKIASSAISEAESDANLVRFALAKERQYLDSIRVANKRIKNNKITKIGRAHV